MQEYENENEYAACLRRAAEELGVKDAKVAVHDDHPSYQGDMDLTLTGKVNGVEFSFLLYQSYGSCSYCDWLERVGDDKVIAEYKKQLQVFLLDEHGVSIAG